MIEIQPPLQIVYLGNGCEGYSPSMFLPAKNEMTTHAQIESHKEYFLQFNYVYTPDRYIGLWWQFRMKMMSEKEARAFITQVAPLGTMDYSLLHKRPPMIKTNYGFTLPVPPVTLAIVGTRGKPRPRGAQEPTMLRTLFRKLTAKAITPYRATSGSVGYDLFTPIDFVKQPQEQRTILLILQ